MARKHKDAKTKPPTPHRKLNGSARRPQGTKAQWLRYNKLVAKTFRMTDSDTDKKFWYDMVTAGQAAMVEVKTVKTSHISGGIVTDAERLEGIVRFKVAKRGNQFCSKERPTAVLVRSDAPTEMRYKEKRPPRPQASLASALPQARKSQLGRCAHSAAKPEGSNNIAPLASHARYEMLGVQLGAGVNGSVWLARRRSDGHHVAMKIATTSDDICDLMMNVVEEFRALDICKHPHVIAALDLMIGSSPFEATLVLEYARCSLEKLVRESQTLKDNLGKLNLTRDAVAYQLFSGVAAVHARRVTHRDLKPSNILICQSPPGSAGILKVADFGLATTHGRVDRSVAQTRSYRAPEVHLGAPCTPHGDMWSIGCVLCELMGWLVEKDSGGHEQTHAPVFEAGTSRESFLKIMYRLGPPPRGFVDPKHCRVLVVAERDWPTGASLPRFGDRPLVALASPEGQSLIDALLRYKERSTAQTSMKHDLFSSQGG